VAAGSASAAEAKAGEASGKDRGPGCRKVAQGDIELPEASGAVWVEASFGLPPHVVAVGDSGTKGAFALIDERARRIGGGRLPLDGGASDDLEGLARIGDLYHAITSSGYVRHFRRTGAEQFELAQAAYPLHPDLVCSSPRKTNCGYDFEGLCLAAGPGAGDGACDGFAASKTRGTLICLRVEDGGRLRAEPERAIQVAPPGMLSGCAIEGDLLLAGNNLFGGNAVTRIRGWRSPAAARLEPVGRLGPGFGEAIAAGPGGFVMRLSDTAGPISAVGVFACHRAGP
jgi:hypothetical protein